MAKVFFAGSSAAGSSAAEPRDAALEVALRALRHRDLSAAELERRLASKGFTEDDCHETLESLRRTGLLDDRRYAEGRAETLADRGAGNAFIRHDLDRAGIDRDLVDEALGLLEPEADRARRIVARRGGGPKTARFLGGKGFSDETVAACVANPRHDELG